MSVKKDLVFVFCKNLKSLAKCWITWFPGFSSLSFFHGYLVWESANQQCLPRGWNTRGTNWIWRIQHFEHIENYERYYWPWFPPTRVRWWGCAVSWENCSHMRPHYQCINYIFLFRLVGWDLHHHLWKKNIQRCYILHCLSYYNTR